MHATAATPHALLQTLTARASELSDVVIVRLHANDPAPDVAPEMPVTSGTARVSSLNS
jgi:hypothetical protein